MALKNKAAPVDSDILHRLQEKYGISPFNIEDDHVSLNLTPAKVDVWQEGLNQEYADQANFEQLIGY